MSGKTQDYVQSTNIYPNICNKIFESSNIKPATGQKDLEIRKQAAFATFS